MPCEPTLFEAIPIFSLLDAEERAVLAQHVEFRRFAARQRIYRIGDPGGRAYLVISGRVHVIVVDADNQEVVIDSPGAGEMFGLASMLSDSPHETSAIAQEETTAIEVDRTTSPSSCSASRWRVSTSSRCWPAISAPPRGWFAPEPRAIPTR